MIKFILENDTIDEETQSDTGVFPTETAPENTDDEAVEEEEEEEEKE